MKHFLILITSIIISVNLFSQVITKPNFALATHPIVVDKVVFSDNTTIVTLTVQSQIENGEFCANEILYLLELPKRTKTYLIHASGIPVCPSTYKFKNAGDKLTFELEFASFEKKPKYINIVEDCDENCFSIYGVIINEQMNEDINSAYNYFTSGNLEFALSSFEASIKENPEYPFSFLYGNIIEIYAQQDNFDQAKQWFELLKASEAIDKDQVIEQIHQKDYYGKLSE